MERNKIKTMFGLLLTIIFLVACSSPANTSTAEPQATQNLTPQSGSTEPAVTSEAGTPMGADGLCSNVYYPVRQGATWNYKSTGSPAGEYSFTDTITSVREDGFTLSTQVNDLTLAQEWACREDGLVALQFGGAPAAMLSAQGMQLNLQVNNVSGITFPDEINAGDQWQHALDLQGSLTVAGQEGTATGSAQNNFTAIGTESVTVPAGTFEAMKIQVETTLNLDVSYEGLTLPVTFSGSYTYWFVQGVGWVKSTGTGSAAGMSFSDTLELQSYNIP